MSRTTRSNALRFGVLSVSIGLVLLMAGCATPPPPPNLGALKNDITEYYKNGRYEKDCARVTREARRTLSAWEGKKKTAIVLDVDDTAISTLPYLQTTDFGYIPSLWMPWAEQADAPAIPGTLELAKQAAEQQTAIFFITSRQEAWRACTEQNLRNAGYPNWTSLIMKQAGDRRNTEKYKTAEREKIIDMGYTIVLNLGDQESDLAGGYAEYTFKLPNPCYWLP
ncbi:MAG: HAD family acid phosphatase [Kiritimatiellae bacterium]|nr:HAD family acid phosphatase [Kiritimatiellia bacterium]MDD4734467.1 HAD family acid phosphatase [Kiritimatiellia bacterium]